MRIFFDTEFIEDGKTIDLISIGIVTEDGRKYYAVSSEYDESKASQWVKDNVLSQIPDTHVRTSRKCIAEEVVLFVEENPEFWAYYADYDWVVLCQLFGTMMDLPDTWPMYCRDIKQMCDTQGNPSLPIQGEGEHNALDDALWNKEAYEFLQDR
ncbi:3'-5' exoribonuclease [Candidatus Pacearchaeota archaeon]|nr:3'-5' exoribonuclease [Candidatus Pacearchaeota archaeon]